MIKFICDRCGKESNESLDIQSIRIQYPVCFSAHLHLRSSEINIADLCFECTAKLKKHIDYFINQAVSPKE